MSDVNLLDKIKEADLVLVGIGEALIEYKDQEAFQRFLSKIRGLLSVESPNYYVVSFGKKQDLLDAGFAEDCTVCPMESEFQKEDWDKYLMWIQNTLNKKLVMVELGVNFDYADLVRFPFEKMAYFNMKSTLVRINKQFPQLPDHLGERGWSVSADPVAFICEEI